MGGIERGGSFEKCSFRHRLVSCLILYYSNVYLRSNTLSSSNRKLRDILVGLGGDSPHLGVPLHVSA